MDAGTDIAMYVRSCSAWRHIGVFFRLSFAESVLIVMGLASWVYLRFLKSFVPSISVTYWKPASISCMASCLLVAPLHSHSLSARFSRCMYFCVVSSLLCPIRFITM